MTRYCLLIVLFSCACSSSHVQVFQTNTEEAFSSWVDQMRAESTDAFEAVMCIGKWQLENMQYEPGLRFIWPGYLDAWNVKTNCAGYARVAIEALSRIGYSEFKMLEIGDANAKGDVWHVVTTDKKRLLSNGRMFNLPEGVSFSDIASMVMPSWTDYKVRERDLTVIEEKTR